MQIFGRLSRAKSSNNIDRGKKIEWLNRIPLAPLYHINYRFHLHFQHFFFTIIYYWISFKFVRLVFWVLGNLFKFLQIFRMKNLSVMTSQTRHKTWKCCIFAIFNHLFSLLFIIEFLSNLQCWYFGFSAIFSNFCRFLEWKTCRLWRHKLDTKRGNATFSPFSTIYLKYHLLFDLI